MNRFHYPVVLSIAGSDSGGGAGIQADLKTIASLGGYGCTAITAITAQNTCGVTSVMPITLDLLKAQIDAVIQDIKVHAVKTGMLYSAEVVRCVAEAVQQYEISKLVVDPVMVATSGDSLAKENIVEAMKRELFPLAMIITPNMVEAGIILGREITTLDEMKEAAIDLLAFCPRGVLLKGGHLKEGEMCDVFITNESPSPIVLRASRVETTNTHGTGCTLSSAIATYLAQGFPIQQAVVKAKEYVSKALAFGRLTETGHGHGPLNHSWGPIPMQLIDKEFNPEDYEDTCK